MAIKGQRLDEDLKEFSRAQYKSETVSAEEMELYLHQSQEDALASGVDSEQVKKFFDYLSLHVFLPWLRKVTGVANVAALLASRFLVYGSMSEENAAKMDVFYDAVERDPNERVLLFIGDQNALYLSNPAGMRALAKGEDAGENAVLLADAKALADAVSKTIMKAAVEDDQLHLSFADGTEYVSGSLRGPKGEQGPKGEAASLLDGEYEGSMLAGDGCEVRAPLALALGVDSIAGARGYSYTSIAMKGDAAGTATITISDDLSSFNWVKGDYIAILNDTGHHVFDLQFQSISGNTVTVIGAVEEMTAPGLLVNISNRSASGNITGEQELGKGAIAIGLMNYVAGEFAAAFGYNNRAGGAYAFVGGRHNKAGYGCTVFGHNNFAKGHYNFISGAENETDSNNTHAEGQKNKATEACAHAEGGNTEATAPYSHSQNRYTKATASNSSANNYRTHAKATNSTTFGRDTIAGGANQIARGKYNVEDTKNRYADVVGNGNTEDERSNAYTLDWKGTGWFAKDIVLGGKNQDDGVSVLDKLDDFDHFITELEEKMQGQVYDQISEVKSTVENFDSELSHERERIVELENQYENIDASLDGFISKDLGAYKIPYTDGNGNLQTAYPWTTAPSAYTFPLRNAGGTLRVGEPIGDDDATTKKYVDGLVGDIETALDGIIAIQESLIGGDA